MSKNPICHIEFPAKDQAKAGAFYQALFGWQLENYPQMDYVVFEPGEGPGGGFPRIDGTGVKAGEVVVYVEVEDLEASLEQAKVLGGELMLPRMPIDDKSWIAIFRDPSGNKVGLYTKNPAK